VLFVYGLRFNISCMNLFFYQYAAKPKVLLQYYSHWRIQRGRVRGFKPPPMQCIFKKFVLYVCKIYSPSPAVIFIKSKILYRKTLKIAHILLQLLGTSSPRPPTRALPLDPTR